MPTDLETILSGQAANAPAPEATPNAPQPETPAAEPQAQPEPSSDAEPQADDRGMVPVAALQAERQKAKRYTEQVADFQKQLAEQRDQFEQRFAQLFGAIQRPQAQPEPVAPPNYWDAPEDFTRREIQQGVEPLTQRQMALAREVAEVRFQPQVVEAAVQAFDQEMAARRLDPAIHARIMNSPNPFAAAVQWHQHTTTMAEMGSDPVAYKAKLAEEIRAQVMAELQQGQQPAAQGAAPVLPSNFATGRNVGARSGPAWSGPTPLGDIFKR
jgi:hypothetical protein